MGSTISRRSTQSSFPELPNDIITEIFSRLPARSIARFHCISKQWAYFLSCTYFTDQLYLTNTSARPCLLFTFHVDGKWLFFSSTQPLNPDQNSSPLVAGRCHLCFPRSSDFFEISRPVNGLICTRDTNVRICNPSSGEYVTLPYMTMNNTFFGYDPIEKQFKVLCVAIKPQKCQVMTFEKGKLLWRIVECSTPHDPECVGICINGLLFYKAMVVDNDQFMLVHYLIVCFEVRSEKFKFFMNIEGVRIQFRLRTLINYKGKLGALINDSDGLFYRRTTCIELWVLDDVEEQKWSRHYYILPPLWQNVVVENYCSLRTVGMSRNGEIVLTPLGLCDPFYIFYYNIERNTIIRVKVQGMEAFKGQKVYSFIDHVEDVRHMEAFMA